MHEASVISTCAIQATNLIVWPSPLRNPFWVPHHCISIPIICTWTKKLQALYTGRHAKTQVFYFSNYWITYENQTTGRLTTDDSDLHWTSIRVLWYTRDVPAQRALQVAHTLVDCQPHCTMHGWLVQWAGTPALCSVIWAGTPALSPVCNRLHIVHQCSYIKQSFQNIWLFLIGSLVRTPMYWKP